jgi:hypothetical protein
MNCPAAFLASLALALDAPPEPAEEESGRLERQFSYVYDVLGEETLRTWYDECRYAATARDSDCPAWATSRSS